MSNKIKNIIIIVLGVLLFTSTYFNYTQKERFDTLALENQKTDSILNVKDQIIYTQAVLRTEDASQITKLTDSIFNLKRKHERQIKNVIAYYSENTKTVIKNVPTRWVDSAYMKQFSDSIKLQCAEVINYYEDSTVKVGRKSYVDSNHFKIALTLKKEGITVDSIEIKDSVHLRFVEKKGGILRKQPNGKRPLFSKKYTEVQVLHTNPYVKITSQTSVIYNPKTKFSIYERGLLIGAGYILGKIY